MRVMRLLDHPNADTRMRSVVILGKRQKPGAATALTACALHNPADVALGLEVVRSLGVLKAGKPYFAALRRLSREHPESQVREAAAQIFSSHGEPH